MPSRIHTETSAKPHPSAGKQERNFLRQFAKAQFQFLSAADLSEEIENVKHTLTGSPLCAELHLVLGLNQVGHKPFGCEHGNHSMTAEAQPRLW